MCGDSGSMTGGDGRRAIGAAAVAAYRLPWLTNTMQSTGFMYELEREHDALKQHCPVEASTAALLS